MFSLETALTFTQNLNLARCNLKHNGTGILRIFKAARCSMSGISLAWKHEAAFRQEMVGGTLLLFVAAVISESYGEFVSLSGPIFLVLIIELINSAIEALADRITCQWDEYIKRAKDIGSAAVFMALAYLALVWSEIIINKWLL